jgi:hypothetical protein
VLAAGSSRSNPVFDRFRAKIWDPRLALTAAEGSQLRPMVDDADLRLHTSKRSKRSDRVHHSFGQERSGPNSDAAHVPGSRAVLKTARPVIVPPGRRMTNNRRTPMKSRSMTRTTSFAKASPVTNHGNPRRGRRGEQDSIRTCHDTSALIPLTRTLMPRPPRGVDLGGMLTV